jgi:hypothetical protein
MMEDHDAPGSKQTQERVVLSPIEQETELWFCLGRE